MIKKLIANIIMISILAGCATIFNNDSRMVQVSGETSETLILTREDRIVKRNIKLPQTLAIPNGWDDWALENSAGEQCKIDRTVNGMTFLNLLLLIDAPIGFIVDAIDGSMSRAVGTVHCTI
ncbi:MAG: hypothetical protein LBR41_02295 [Rickettsiales bacterium]|jgi:hypothetical protein|nr:hypothetical protein [Rickettsiales bacterium]